MFASATLYLNASGSELPAVNVFGSEAPRVAAQAVAVLAAGVFAFVVTAVLVKGIDATCGFCLDPQAEGEGLDRAAHGEGGFDLGPTLDATPVAPATEPAASGIPAFTSERAR